MRNVRHSLGLARPSPLEPGELTVTQVAARLDVKPGTIYYWITTGLLPARKPATGEICIPFSPEIQATLRARRTRRVASTTTKAVRGAV